jgi:hypothetical protein
MISYTEKGSWLFDELNSNGLSLSMLDGKWVYNQADEEKIQTIIDTFDPLPHARADALQIINGAIQQQLQEIVAAYPELEITSWPQQAAEAVSYQLDPAATTPVLSAIAKSSGSTVKDLAARVTKKANDHAEKLGQLVGLRQAVSDPIKTTTDWSTIAELTASAIKEIKGD